MRIWSREEVADRTGLSIRTLHRLEADGEFPRRRRISRQRVGWLSTDVRAWMEERPPAQLPANGNADN